MSENEHTYEEHIAYSDYCHRFREVMPIGLPNDMKTYINWYKNHLEKELRIGNEQAEIMKNELIKLLSHVTIIAFDSFKTMSDHRDGLEICSYAGRCLEHYRLFGTKIRKLIESELDKVTRFINDSNDESKEIVCKRVLLEYLDEK